MFSLVLLTILKLMVKLKFLIKTSETFEMLCEKEYSSMGSHSTSLNFLINNSLDNLLVAVHLNLFMA